MTESLHEYCVYFMTFIRNDGVIETDARIDDAETGRVWLALAYIAYGKLLINDRTFCTPNQILFQDETDEYKIVNRCIHQALEILGEDGDSLWGTHIYKKFLGRLNAFCDQI